MTEYTKPFNDLTQVLPLNLRNSVNTALLDNLFNRSFTHEEVVNLFGLVGRQYKDSSETRPWLSSINLDREINSLVPVMETTLGIDTIVKTFEDIINKCDILGIDTTNLDTIFTSLESFNFLPPIDLDKFINFSNYYWIQLTQNDIVPIWNSDQKPEYYVIEKPKTGVMSDWSKYNYWVHKNDLTSYGLDVNSNITQALRPIIEYDYDLELVPNYLKTRYNQLPLFTTYYPFDNSLAPYISSLFYYQEDPNGIWDPVLLRKVKADKIGNFIFSQGLISPDNKILAYKKGNTFYTIWKNKNNLKETSVAVCDRTGTGLITNVKVTDTSTPTIWIIEGAPESNYNNSTSTLAFYKNNVYLDNLGLNTDYSNFGISFTTGNKPITVGTSIIIISGISTSNFSNNESWELKYKNDTTFTLYGHKSGYITDITIDSPFTNEFISLTLLSPFNGFNSTDKFIFYASGPQTIRNVKKVNDNVITDTTKTGVWLSPPQLLYNPEQENRKEILYGDLADHFTDIISKQPELNGIAYGSNNSRNMKINTDFGGNIKVLDNNTNLFLGLMNDDNFSVISLLDFLENSYKIALNSISDFLVTLLPSVLPTLDILTIPNLFDKYEENYVIKSQDFNIFGTSTSSIKNWPLTLPLLGIGSAVQPEIIFDLDLEAYAIKHSDGHISPLTLPDKIFEHNIALQKVLRYDGLETPGTADVFEPLRPYKGQLWFDKNTSTLKFLNITFEGSDIPTNPTIGNTWYDRLTNILSIWNGISWTTISSGLPWVSFNFNDLINSLILFCETKLYNAYLLQNTYNKSLKWSADNYINNIELSKDLAKFSIENNYEPYATDFNIDLPFTWNYRNADASIYGITNTARWQELYIKYFNTFNIDNLSRPDLEPWKFFGLTSKPTNWIFDYPFTNDILTGNLIDTITLVSINPIDINNPPTTIDGKTLSTNDTVLLVNQNNASEDGIYRYDGISLISIGTTILTSGDWVTVSHGVHMYSTWTTVSGAWVQVRKWQPTLWDTIKSIYPNIVLCVNEYTDMLLPPYVGLKAVDITDVVFVNIPNNVWSITHVNTVNARVKVYREGKYLISPNEYVIDRLSSTSLTITFKDPINILKGTVEVFTSNALFTDIPENISDNFYFGENGPVELIWRKSLNYKFAQTKLSFLKDPINFTKSLWGFQDFYSNFLQLDRITGQLFSNNNLPIFNDSYFINSNITITNNSLPIISAPISLDFVAFYQQNDSEMLLFNDKYNIVVKESNFVIHMPLAGISSVDCSINYNGLPLLLGDTIRLNITSQGVTGELIRGNINRNTGLSQVYTQYLKYMSIDSGYNKHIKLLKEWKVKLGYRTSSLIETDVLKVDSDIIGAIPNTAYNVVLAKRPFCREIWFHSLRIVVTKIGSNNLIAHNEITSFYSPKDKGIDWEFKIEGYFDRNPEIIYYALDTNGSYETFTDFNQTNSEQWLHYLNTTTLHKTYLPIKITGIQNLINFIFGYEAYLTSQGLLFGYGENPSTDITTGRIKNWQFEIEKMIDFLYNGTFESAGISLNPGLEKFAISTPYGLPSSMVFSQFNDLTTNAFVYDMIGHVINKDGYTIIRNDSITEIIGQVPLLGAHILIDYFEHYIVFENYISNNIGLLFDPFIGTITEKLSLSTKIKNNINFRPSFGGFFLQDNKFKKNITQSIDNVSNYYNSSKMFNDKETSRHALSLLGFSTKGYAALMDMDPLTEFNYWRGLVNAKGTTYSIDTLLNSVKFEYAKVDEFWAYKIAEYGDARTKVYPELKIESRDTLLKHTRLYFKELNETSDIVIDRSFTSIYPDDESRWYTHNDLNTNLSFDTEIITITINAVANELVEIIPCDKILKIINSTGIEITNYTIINATTLRFDITDTYIISGYRPLKPKSSPIKLIDYASKEVLDDITVWHPAYDIHCPFGLEYINITSTFDPAKYNYSTLTTNNLNYEPTKIWGDREVGRVWWDINNLEYVPYYDEYIFPDFEERLARWGSLTEYSTINIYEWTKSDVPPIEYNKLAPIEQLVANKENKKSGTVANESIYKRTRNWLARPVAWSYVPTPPESQDVQQFTSATNRLFLSNISLGATQVVLESGRFNQYGITSGMHLSAWLGNKPYGELELTGNESYLIGSSTLTGGDSITIPGHSIFDYISITWSNNKNYIGSAIGKIDISPKQFGTNFYLVATDSTGLSYTCDITDANNVIENSIIEYDFNDLGFKLRCNIAIANTLLSASAIFDEFVNLQTLEELDIVIRSYLNGTVLIPLPKNILDNALPINLPSLYSSSLTVEGLGYFSSVTFTKNTSASIGTYSIYNNGNIITLRHNTILQNLNLTIDNIANDIPTNTKVTELTLDLGDISIIATLSTNFYDNFINGEDLANELSIIGSSIVVGYDNATSDILIEVANELILGEYGWKAWKIPSQTDLDNDLKYPHNSWMPIFGNYSSISSTKPIIDNIIAYDKAKLVLNDSSIIDKYKSIWNNWIKLEKEKLVKLGNDNVMTFVFSEKTDDTKVRLYVNGISQPKANYTVDNYTVTTNIIIPLGYKVVCIRNTYEPTSEELKFDPLISDDVSKQEQYKKDYQYVIKDRRNEYGNIIGNDYYFWVKNKTIPFKSSNEVSIQQATILLEKGPDLYLTFQALKDDKYKGITINGLNNIITKDKTYKLRFIQNETLRDDPNDLDLKNVHSEWMLLRKDQNKKIPKILWDKLVDSAVGQNLLGEPLPSIKLALYDERYNTQTRIGLGKNQVIANKDLVINSIKQCIKNPKVELYRNGINTLISFNGIDVSNLDTLFATESSIRKILDFIWRTALPQQINSIFFEVLNDALACNYEFSDIFKTSRLSAHSIKTINQEIIIHDTETYI